MVHHPILNIRFYDGKIRSSFRISSISFVKKITNLLHLILLQASNQREFDLWVKTIAIELIRQTPLDAIKYLDILTLTPQVHSTPKPEATEKDCNDNSIPNPIIQAQIQHNTHTFRPKCLNFDKLDENRNYCHSRSHEPTIEDTTSLPPISPKYQEKFLSLNIPSTNTNTKSASGKIDQDDEQTVELLLKKCQNADSYVPVKEKLKLFESLCRIGRIVNNEETSATNSKYSTKRTRSLHDLSNSEYPPQSNNAGVKQICKYFETKNDENKEKDTVKFNTIARGNRTSFGPVKTMISRKYSIQSKNY